MPGTLTAVDLSRLRFVDDLSLRGFELQSLRRTHRLYLQHNEQLVDLQGFPTSLVVASIEIERNDQLASLAGLEHLRHHPGSLRLVRNDALTALTGLENLAVIGGDVTINSNDLQGGLSGLRGLRTVGGTLSIAGNHQLGSAFHARLRR